MHSLTGIILIVISAAGFSTLAIFGRYAYADGMDTLTILFLRFSCSAVVLAGLLAVRREGLPHGIVMVQLMGMGAVGYIGHSFCFLAALQYASPGLVALLLYLYPTFVAILAWVALRERMTRVKACGLVVATIGTALTVGPESGRIAGILLATLAAVIYSLYILVGAHVMRQVSAFQSSTIIFGSAGVMSGILMLANGPKLPQTPMGWMAVAGIVLIATVLPVTCFLAGLKHIGPTNTSMLSTLEPFITVMLAVVLLGETLKPVSLIGGGLIILAVLLLVRGELRRPRAQQAREQGLASLP
ncbi:MAG: DMT family transporter [Syntrophobacteraceae bacterium]